ncbi:Hypothetical predicted protein [Marmota monax]|uniref:Uncharacterized protein n=1 Tax=Marmota monax TaxID=9995 RepID=A0A5E4C115_MARMO|nr:Hypothetical predicted protein [Marmota monax]
MPPVGRDFSPEGTIPHLSTPPPPPLPAATLTPPVTTAPSWSPPRGLRVSPCCRFSTLTLDCFKPACPLAGENNTLPWDQWTRGCEQDPSQGRVPGWCWLHRPRPSREPTLLCPKPPGLFASQGGFQATRKPRPHCDQPPFPKLPPEHGPQESGVCARMWAPGRASPTPGRALSPLVILCTPRPSPLAGSHCPVLPFPMSPAPLTLPIWAPTYRQAHLQLSGNTLSEAPAMVSDSLRIHNERPHLDALTRAHPVPHPGPSEGSTEPPGNPAQCCEDEWGDDSCGLGTMAVSARKTMLGCPSGPSTMSTS